MNIGRFLAGHVLAVFGSGLFAAVFILALQGVMLSLLGERFFRKISLVLQSLLITALLLMLFLLADVLLGCAGAAQVGQWLRSLLILRSGFWVFTSTCWKGRPRCLCMERWRRSAARRCSIVGALAVLTYPLAYLRRVRQLVEGPGARSTRSWLRGPIDRILHWTVVRPPVRRAVFHFISQTVLRVPRYRIYLVLYGGVGLSLVVTAILRFALTHGSVRIVVSADGIRSALGIVAFWVIAGMRMTFVSSGNRQGNWAFRIVHGRPPELSSALEQLRAARIWVMLWACAITLGTWAALRAISPNELLTWPATVAQVLVAGGMCLLLTDLLFLSVTTVAFTGEPTRDQPNLAFTVLKYYTAFPVVACIPNCN